MARKLGILANIGISSALLLAAANASAAGVPKFLTEQGRLFDKTGAPVTGTISFVFTVYTDKNGTNNLWTETDSITLDDGYFSTLLGDGTAFPVTLFNGQQLYLGVKVGTDAELRPLQPLVSVPYALMADTAGNAVGDITPNTVTVAGNPVIDKTGKWVGDPTGLVGPQGPAGAPGGAGTPGAQGAPGAQGPKGDPGGQGNPGAQGAPGTPGAPGAKGADGVDGAKGPQGPTGATGVGVAGTPGAQGAPGPTGPSGILAVLGPYYATLSNPAANLTSMALGTTAAAPSYTATGPGQTATVWVSVYCEVTPTQTPTKVNLYFSAQAYRSTNGGGWTNLSNTLDQTSVLDPSTGYYWFVGGSTQGTAPLASGSSYQFSPGAYMGYGTGSIGGSTPTGMTCGGYATAIIH